MAGKSPKVPGSSDYSQALIRHVCVYCGVTFWSHNSNRLTCSDRCRTRLSRWRRRLSDLEGRLLTLVDEAALYLPYDAARISACSVFNNVQQRIHEKYREAGIVPIRGNYHA